MDQKWVNRYLKHSWNKRREKTQKKTPFWAVGRQACWELRAQKSLSGIICLSVMKHEFMCLCMSVFSLELWGFSIADKSSVSYLRAVLRTCKSIDWLILLCSAALCIWLSIICEGEAEGRVRENIRTGNLWCLNGKWVLPLSCS